jgi:hypothetical protein
MGYILPTNQTLYFPSRNETNKAGKHNREKTSIKRTTSHKAKPNIDKDPNQNNKL